MIEGTLADSLGAHVVQVALVLGAVTIRAPAQVFEQPPNHLPRDFVVLVEQRGEPVEVAVIEKRWVENGEVVNVAHQLPPHRDAGSRPAVAGGRGAARVAGENPTKRVPFSLMSLTIRPISPAAGAEIAGVDLSSPLRDVEFEAVHGALLAHGAVFLRDQTLTPRNLIEFPSRLGPLNVHPMMQPLNDYPAILEIVKNPEDRNDFGGSWHTEPSYVERPALASLLYAKEIPPTGGDTLFANMYLAFNGYRGYRRVMHRVSVEGDRPV